MRCREVLLVSLSAGLIAIPGRAGDAAADREGAAVIARVAGKPVTRDRFADWLLRVHGPALKREFLDQIAVEEAARTIDVHVDSSEVQDALDREWSAVVELRFGGDENAYLAELRQTGHTRESFYASRFPSMRNDLLLRRIAVARRPTDEDALRERFRRDFGDPPRRTSVRVLTLERRRLMRDPKRLPRGARPRSFTEIDAITRELAEALRRRLSAGEDFAAIAREYSDHVTRARGGWIPDYRPGVLSPSIDDALSRLSEDAPLSPVIPTETGYAICRLEGREPVDFESVEEELILAIRSADVSAAELEAALRFCRDAAVVELPPP